MSALTNSEEIVTKMITEWSSTGGESVFGYPQDVDNIHKKVLPLMIINPPEMIISTTDYNRNTILVNSNWTFTAYEKHDTSLKNELGDELIQNAQDWTGATGSTPPNNWTDASVGAVPDFSVAAPTNTMKMENTAGGFSTQLFQKFTLEIGQTYRCDFSGLGGVVNSYLLIGTTEFGSEYISVPAYATSDLVFEFVATSVDICVGLVAGGTIGNYISCNSISIKKVNHNLEILAEWDVLETKILSWFNKWWYSFEDDGNDFVLTSPIQITRIKEASNDRLLGLKVTFGFNFYRYCNP